jgi:hypothetical protein
MNRLSESGGGDPTEPGIELLRRTPPTGPMPGLKRRVWASLQERQIRAPGGLRVTRLVAATAMGAAIVALAGSAGAVIAGRWIIPALDRPSAAPAARVSGSHTDRARVVRRVADRVSDLAAIEEVGAAPVVEASVPAADESASTARRPAVATGARAAGHAPAVAARPAVASAQAAAQERTEVLDALIALRRDHDPARASALLDRYLAAHRHGALREEALVLAIEAADARGDRASGERLARAYSAQYPDGRFERFAQNHLASNASAARSASPALDGKGAVAAPAQRKD